MERSSSRPVVLKNTLNEILFHKDSITDRDQQIIHFIKKCLEKMPHKKICEKILNENKKFRHLEKKGLDELSIFVLKSGVEILKKPDCPLRGRNLFGGLGKRFINSMSDNLKTKEDVEVLFDYLKIRKRQLPYTSASVF